MAIKAVVFDIGNVLIEWQPERFYDRMIGIEKRQDMFADLDLHGMNDIIDRGGHFKDTIYDFAAANAKWAAEIRMWHDNWIELASPAIDHSVRLLRQRCFGVCIDQLWHSKLSLRAGTLSLSGRI